MALACEAAGFFYVGVCDHTFIPDRLAGAMNTTWYDTVATLGWLAGVTTDIRLLSHIYVIALRHPLRAAKEFATLDALSGGRVICGVGAGHVAEEFDLMGPDFDHRGAATDEAIAGLANGLVARVPRARRAPVEGVGRRAQAPAGPVPPATRSGSGDRRRPHCSRAARFADGWLPQSLGPDPELLAELRRMRDEFRGGAPLDIGGIADFLYVGTPPPASSCPGGRWPVRPRRWPSTCAPSRRPGWARCRCGSPPVMSASSATRSPPSPTRSSRWSTADPLNRPQH